MQSCSNGSKLRVLECPYVMRSHRGGGGGGLRSNSYCKLLPSPPPPLRKSHQNLRGLALFRPLVGLWRYLHHRPHTSVCRLVCNTEFQFTLNIFFLSVNFRGPFGLGLPLKIQTSSHVLFSQRLIAPRTTFLLTGLDEQMAAATAAADAAFMIVLLCTCGSCFTDQSFVRTTRLSLVARINS
jgi:hypothetical protein